MDDYVEKVQNILKVCIGDTTFEKRVEFYKNRLDDLKEIYEKLSTEILQSDEYFTCYDDWSIEFIYKYWFTCEYLKEKISRTKMKLNNYLTITGVKI